MRRAGPRRRISVRTLPAIATLLLRHLRRLGEIGRTNHDPWWRPFGRIGDKQLARLQATLAGSHFTDVDNVTGLERETIEDDAPACVRRIARHVNVDLPHAKHLAFFHLVDQIQVRQVLPGSAATL